MSYENDIKETRRLDLLRVLHQTPGHGASADLLRDGVHRIYGHNVSVHQVSTDLNWLAVAGVVEVRNLGDVTMASLAPLGRDLLADRASVPGIKDPMSIRAPGTRA